MRKRNRFTQPKKERPANPIGKRPDNQGRMLQAAKLHEKFETSLATGLDMNPIEVPVLSKRILERPQWSIEAEKDKVKRSMTLFVKRMAKNKKQDKKDDQ